MKTSFSDIQLADSHMAVSEKILRSCVHCGFCTATCPTYLLMGDELDSPRGRIYLIKDMLENGKPANAEVVKHIDRCLSCLSCMTTCPSGVHYMHLVDHARAHIYKTYKRSWADRFMRAVLAAILPYPQRFRLALLAAFFAKPLRPLLAHVPVMGPQLSAMIDLAPSRFIPRPRSLPAAGMTGPRAKVVILEGCAQPVLNANINLAARRLLARHNVDVVNVPKEGCCGSLVHHMGREEDGLSFARHNIDQWMGVIEREGVSAILVTTSGCGTTIKDYGFMLRDDKDYAQKAERISSMTKDVTEFVATLTLDHVPIPAHSLAYHSACSMQHGQKITDLPKSLLRAAGFRVKDVPEGHICCGSAGVYNILQPTIAEKLRLRKVDHIERLHTDLIATGNIGCMTQIGKGTEVPIVHTVELLDWATGGPKPEALEALSHSA
jgi:glycolate oxidase iron-sulfur subunit